MSAKDDAAPFLVLQKDAENFKKTFQQDIDDCICTLNSKITSLICEPETLSNPFGEQRHASGSARTEFAKAKYDVFLTVNTLFSDMEQKWNENISEMKESFLESVELFLAGTKLEVKFPSSTEIARLSTKISPVSKEKKSPNSIYPSLHNLGLEDTFVSPQRDTLRRLAYNISDLSSSPALNLSPLKQNLCDIEEEEISDDNENIVEFLPDSAMYLLPEKAVKSTPRRRTMHDRRLNDNFEDNEEQYTVGKTNTRKRVSHIPEPDFQDNEERYTVGKTNTRKKVSLIPEPDFQDFDLTFPAENIRTNTRRKTMHAKFNDNDLSESDIVPERTTRTKSKRKTICLLEDKAEPPAAPSPKRLKRSGSLKTTKSGLAASNTPGKSFSLMDCDEAAADKTLMESPSKHNYNNWVSIQSISDNVPKTPGVYELKVWRAKKTAYIGCSENLSHQLLLHKKMQNSGHKHLDKFLERNVSDVQVRFELSPSLSDAKMEVKNRIKEFVEKYKTTPAYN